MKITEDQKRRLKEIIRKILHKHLEEESSTGTGASFNAGQGEQYATPFAFKKKGAKEQVKYPLGYKAVPKDERFKGKSFDVEKWH